MMPLLVATITSFAYPSRCETRYVCVGTGWASSQMTSSVRVTRESYHCPVRIAFALASLFPLAAAAHVVPFDFVNPAGTGNHADGGTSAGIVWQSNGPTGQAPFTL